MLATVSSATLVGVDGHAVAVEVHVSNGLPGFRVVGLPDASCRESRDRARAAIISSGFKWPQRRVTVNLAPSGLRKAGSGLDVAIALGVLAADDQVPVRCVDGLAFIGELGLDGSLRRVPGVLPLVAAIKETTVVVAPACAQEASFVQRSTVRAVATLRDLVQVLKAGSGWPELPVGPDVEVEPPAPDLAEVRGQPFGRQALEVAAAGGHHLLMVGPAGAGKTMLARRLPGILPPLSQAEALEVANIYSAAGLDSGGRRPLCAATLQVTSPQRLGRVADRWRRRQASAGRDQLRPLRGPVPGRAGRVPRFGARQPAPASGGGSGRRVPGQRRRGLPRPFHAGGGDERVPLRG